MSDLEHLGDALREQLHALVADMNPSTELIASVDALPESHARRGLRPKLGWLSRRRFAVALPVPVAAIAAAVVLLVGASGPTTTGASAIKALPNGDIQVALAQLSAVTAVNAELRRHHIHNMVVVPMTASCPNRNMTYTAGGLNPAVITLTPRTIAPGWTVVLAAKQIGPDTMLTAFGRFKGRIPRCASSHGTGPGMGDLNPGAKKSK